MGAKEPFDYDLDSERRWKEAERGEFHFDDDKTSAAKTGETKEEEGEEVDGAWGGGDES